MGKFGKKNVISEDISKYSICLLGEGGIGKTTLLYTVTDKLFGEGSTLFLELGKEQGADAIDGILYEDVPTWKKFEEITNDIIKNKATDYPELKLVVLDTLDQAIDIASAETIRRWNAENMSKPNYTPVSTLNGAYGGFGAGMDYCVNLILNKMWELKKVGVNVWLVGHIKVRPVVDNVTGGEYSTLTTDVTQRMFNAFKNKMHIVAIAYLDRKVETVGTGRQNIVSRKEITMNKVVNEARRISFRDESNYIIDSKSRFANIVPDIPMDADAFIKAIKDAIASEKKKPSSESTEPTPAPKPEPVVEEKEEVPFDEDVAPMNEPVELAEGEYPDDLLDIIKSEVGKTDKEKKSKAVAILKEHGLKKVGDASEDVLQELYDILCR